MWNLHLATVVLATVPAGDAHPPQPPPGFGDDAQVEALLARFAALCETDAHAEIQRARAKVHEVLRWIELEEALARAAEDVARTEREIASRRASGVTRFGRLEAELAVQRERRDELRAIVLGTATADLWRRHVGPEAVPDFFFPLAPDAAGRRRPRVRTMDGTIDAFAPLVAYSGELDAAALRRVESLARTYREQGFAMPADQWALLQELSDEAGRCLALLAAGRTDEARAVADARWAWVRAWGSARNAEESVVAPRAGVAAADSDGDR